MTLDYVLAALALNYLVRFLHLMQVMFLGIM